VKIQPGKVWWGLLTEWLVCTESFSVDTTSIRPNCSTARYALFDVEHEQMVIVTNIEFQSLCEHHILPFTGLAHVAYVPDNKVVGLSKIPRIVDMYARRLQIQERMTKQIAETVSTLVEPLGVGVTLTGSHMCSTIRGVRKQNSLMTTSCMTGSLKSDSLLRSEFLTQIQIDKQ
jgi:GTP cyclohydrolase I